MSTLRHSMYRVTKWDWLRMRLEVFALRSRSDMFSVDFTFRTPLTEDIFHALKLGTGVEIICNIYGAHAYEMIDTNASRNEQVEYYWDWVKAERQHLQNIMDETGVSRKQFDIRKHVTFFVMYSYGAGADPICRVLGEDVAWFNSEPRHPKKRRRKLSIPSH